MPHQPGIQQGDCIERMNAMPQGSVDLIFADPPFNIGYDYDVYRDSVGHEQYLAWSRDWIGATHRVLKDDGTFWLAIGDEYAAELKLLAQEIGYHCRSWVIWYYTFGVNCSRKFTRSHAHLFHFVKDPGRFTFLEDDLDNRVPSARELVYNDKRANPKGRLPDDTWVLRPGHLAGDMVDDTGLFCPAAIAPPNDPDRTFVLRPQDLPGGFDAREDTWYVPRVAGTFKERAGFHGCQMPEQLLGRIIRICSHPGDWVLDPFSGSATTLAVAKKLGRGYLGFELSQDYVDYGKQRLADIKVGDRLDGSPEPLKSARPTVRRKSDSAPDAAEERYDAIQLELTLGGIVDAFRRTHQGYSADRIVADPDLNSAFVAACRERDLVGDATTWNRLLFRLRKQGQLAEIPTLKRTHISWSDCGDFLFASEIAWQQLVQDKVARSLDDILCDPGLAQRFDDRARQLAPGFTPLQYRWCALMIRKAAKTARGRATVLSPPTNGPPQALTGFAADDIPQQPGAYLLHRENDGVLYAGETDNLHDQLARFQENQVQQALGATGVQWFTLDLQSAGRFAWQSCLVRKHHPLLNCREMGSAR